MPQQNNLQIAFCVLRNDSSNACLQTNLYGSAVWKKRFVFACGRRLLRANKPTGGVLRQRIAPNLQRNLGAHSHKSKNIVLHKFCQAICVFCCRFLSVFVLRSDQTCNAGVACSVGSCARLVECLCRQALQGLLHENKVSVPGDVSTALNMTYGKQRTTVYNWSSRTQSTKPI